MRKLRPRDETCLVKDLALSDRVKPGVITMALMLVLFLLHHGLDHIELFTEQLLSATGSVYASSSDFPNTFLTKEAFCLSAHMEMEVQRG